VLHTGFFLLQFLQQFLQLGDIGAGGFQLLLGVSFLVGEGRRKQQGQENQGKGAKNGAGGTWDGDAPSMPKKWPGAIVNVAQRRPVGWPPWRAWL
jgi:hypothetical protein